MRRRRYLLWAILAAGLALILSPGSSHELIHVVPSGLRDKGGWTHVDPQFRPERSAEGTDLTQDATTFRFRGEHYAIPLAPGTKFLEAFSVSLWARVPETSGSVALLSLETDNGTPGRPGLMMFAQGGGRRMIFGFVTLDFFGSYRLLRPPQDVSFAAGQWVHLVYVVDHAYGLQTMYIDGIKQATASLMPGTCRAGNLTRLWLGSSPEVSDKGTCELSDVHILAGPLAWWQIQAYRVSGRYFYSVLGIPPLILVIGLWMASFVCFILGVRRLTTSSREISPDPPALDSKVPAGLWLPKLLNNVFLLTALVGFFFVVFAFYPGAMSPDSVDQYGQGRAWQFVDWHPPFMAAVMGIFDRIFHSPAPMLILQVAIYWLGFYLLARAFLRISTPVACIFGFFGFWPAFLTWTGVLWKDVGTASAFLFAAALLVFLTVDQRRPRWPVLVLILLAMLYGALVRTYSFLAYLPLALWLSDLVCQDRPLRRPRTAVAMLFVGLAALFLVTDKAVKAILKPTSHHQIQIILYHDLLALSAGTDKCLVHSYHRPDVSCAEVRRMYSPGGVDPFWNPSNPIPEQPETGPVLRDWLAAVRAHPWAYLAHRAQSFAILFAFHNRPNWNQFRGIEANSFGFTMAQNDAGRAFDSYIFHSFSWIFYGYVYLLLAVYEVLYLATVLAARRSFADLGPIDRCILFLCLSTLMYFLPYFFVVPARDFRFLYWGTMASTVAFILMLYTLFASFRSMRRPPQRRKAA